MSERTERPSVRRRACTNCMAGKAKCTPFSPEECERCRRLGKGCRYDSLPTTRKRPQPSSRLQVLERKVKELATRQEYQPHRISTRLFDHDTDSSTSLGASQWSTSTGSPSNLTLTGSTHPRISSIGVNNSDRETGDIIDRSVVTQELAQLLLDRFRTNATQQFPFVIISADASLEAVRKKTPFLFLAVTATMIFDNPFLQHQLGEEVRQQAFQRILLGAEKSLDLLQGLLIYIAWYCHFYRVDKHQEFLLSQLCVTLAHDLGIDKSKKRQVDRLDQSKPPFNIELSSSLANAQMRAYLGTYCVSCLVASTLRRRTALPYTKYMDHCCRLLVELKEYKTDELIPHFVRSQELSRRIVDTFSYDDLNNGEIRGELLVVLTSDAFTRDLNRLRLEIPLDFQKNTLLDLEFHVNHILINETALHAEFWTGANDPHQAPDLSSASPARLKMLWRSLNSCKDFILTFLSYRNQDLFYLTAFIYPRLYFVFITLVKLVFLDSEGSGAGGSDQSDTWDFQSHPWSTIKVAKEADFQELAKQVLEKFTAVSTDFVGSDGQRDAMSNLASAMQILMAGYVQQKNGMQRALQSAETPTSSVEMAQELTEAATNSTTYSSVEAIGNGGDSGTFDKTLVWEDLGNMVWDDLLDNFTMGPFL